MINHSFIENYGKFALGLNNPLKLAEELQRQKILHFTKYDNRFKILKGTDLDFEIAINEAGSLIERIKDITLPLNRYFNFPVILSKRVSYKTGTPRLFSFVLSDEPINNTPKDEIDGFINLVFNKNITEHLIKKTSKNCNRKA